MNTVLALPPEIRCVYSTVNANWLVNYHFDIYNELLKSHIVHLPTFYWAKLSDSIYYLSQASSFNSSALILNLLASI
jgi:hypothetical protein